MSTPPLCTGVCDCVYGGGGGGSEYTALMSPNIRRNSSSRLQSSYPYFYTLVTSLSPTPPHFTAACVYIYKGIMFMHSNGVILTTYF